MGAVFEGSLGAGRQTWAALERAFCSGGMAGSGNGSPPVGVLGGERSCRWADPVGQRITTLLVGQESEESKEVKILRGQIQMNLRRSIDFEGLDPEESDKKYRF